MAREYAPLWLSIWSDEDFLDLTGDAQRLYFTLIGSPSLTYAGVADWRPRRASAMCRDWDERRVIAAGSELADRLYAVVDEGTEEVLVRSYVRHDKLLKSPNLAIAMATAYGSIASRSLRGVIVHELKRLHEEEPGLAAWTGKQSREPLAALLTKTAVDPATYPCGKPSPQGSRNPSTNPSRKGSRNPSRKGSVKGHPPVPVPEPVPGSAPTERATQERRGAERDSERQPKQDEPPESQVAKAVYDETQGMIKFIAIQGVARRALRVQGASVPLVVEAMLAIYRSDKPITFQSVGQYMASAGKASRTTSDRSNPETVAPPLFDPAAEVLKNRRPAS